MCVRVLWLRVLIINWTRNERQNKWNYVWIIWLFGACHRIAVVSACFCCPTHYLSMWICVRVDWIPVETVSSRSFSLQLLRGPTKQLVCCSHSLTRCRCVRVIRRDLSKWISLMVQLMPKKWLQNGIFKLQNIEKKEKIVCVFCYSVIFSHIWLSHSQV